MVIYEFKGVDGYLKVYEDKIDIVPKGIIAFLNKGLKGTKTIPYSSIKAIQFKKCGILLSGYIQFTIPGGNESKKGIFDAVKDENTFLFHSDNKLAIEIKEYIESKIVSDTNLNQNHTNNIAEQMEQLASLYKDGSITEDEYELAKNKVLGII